jgi:hypothetical protein
LAPSLELTPDSAAYIDADWLTAGDDEVPTLIWRRGVLTWRDRDVPIPTDGDPDLHAATTLLAVAEDAVSSIGTDVGVGAGRVEVVGRGLVAGLIRMMLGVPSGAAPASPIAIVTTVADQDVLTACMSRLESLGTLVVVGESRGGVDIDLYRDVHVRGLHLVGVAPPITSSPPSVTPSWFAGYLASHPASVVAPGAPLPSASWYRVQA